VVRDGNVITGGGVTAGIDFALTILTEVAGEDFAKTMQLNLEYAPAPPYQSGRPETAPKEILDGALAMYARLRPQRDAEAQSAAAKLVAMA
jgi:transcriptional regulator GlxA family with amidase domain